MEKLNELPQAFYGVIKSGKVVMLPAEDGQWLNKTSVAEAFRALEQRAEAAEAKLAEMEKQKPVAYLTWHQGFRSPDDCEDYLVVASNGDKSCDGSKAFPVFNRPAPAADLAELVPDEMTWNQAHSLLDINQCGEDRFSAFMMGANYNRSAILRNIEEAK